MKYKIWNKKDEINGVDAEYIIDSHKIKDIDEIFLIIDEVSNRTLEIQFKDVICSNFGISSELSIEEVAQRYLEIKEEEIFQQEKETSTQEELLEKIAILEENQKAILRGDMQTLAYNLYPEDFIN